MLTVFTDGGSRGNPGKSACAFVVYDDEKTEVYSYSKYLGINTNNFAEYNAVLEVVSWSPEGSIISLYSDSELMVKQLNGIYKIKNPILQKLAIEIKSIIIKKRLNIKFSNVLRNKNVRADELVNFELDKQSS